MYTTEIPGNLAEGESVQVFDIPQKPKSYPRNRAIEDAATLDQLGREAYRLHKRVHDLEVYRETLTRERDELLAAVRPIAEQFLAYDRERFEPTPEFCSKADHRGERVPNGVTVRVALLRGLVAVLGEPQ